MARVPRPFQVAIVSLVLAGLVPSACAAPPTLPVTPAAGVAAPPNSGPLDADAVSATQTAIAATDRTATAAAATPTITPTPVPQRTPLALPATHPMATTWVLGAVPGVFERASRLAVDDDGDLFLVDTNLHRVSRFDRDGQLVTTWGSQGFGPGQFMFQMEGVRATALAAAPRGLVYVADATNRIQKFDKTGRFISVIAGDGTGDGQIKRAGGLAVDVAGNLYVTDTDNHRVQKFDPTGRLLVKWGSLGTRDGQFQQPAGIAVDQQGFVYVSDSSARIQKFTTSGQFVTGWGVRGEGNGEFKATVWLAVNRQGIVFAADWANHRIQAFDWEGNYLLHWGGFGSDVGQLRWPGGVAVDAQGDIYVTDILNMRVQKFRPRAAWPTTTRGTPTPRPPTPTVPPTNTPAPLGPPPFMTPTDR